MGYYSAIKKNEILPFVTTWMDLEALCQMKEVRQGKTDTVWLHFYVASKKYNK